MKQFYFLTLAVLLFSGMSAQVINFPDANFKAKLISLGVDTNFDGNIQQTEASAKLSLNLDSANITDLTGINAFSNLLFLSVRFNSISDLTSLNGLANLASLDCNSNQIATLSGLNNFPDLQTLLIGNNPITSLSGIGNFTNLASLSCYNCTQLSYVSDLASLPNLRLLDISYSYQVPLVVINNLTSITNLTCRGVFYSAPVSSISNLTNLTSLSIGNNNLASLNLSYFPNLMELFCDQNNISTLNLSAVPNLTRLECSSNNLYSLNLTSLTHLQDLDCGANHLTVLDLSSLNQLTVLDCHGNNIGSLDFSALPLLASVNCSGNNNITTIDVSNQHQLSNIMCSDMHNLVSVFMKNGSANYGNTYYPFAFSNCPRLAYVCVDDPYITTIQSILPGCNVNSYCSFSPGTAFYRIQGNDRFDIDNNGCNATDINYPNLKLTFSNGNSNSTFFANATGNFHYDVEAGNYIVVPEIENPLYFDITPTTSSVSFPSAASPYDQNFCITANGTHNDLEVTLIPISRAQAGFDSAYKIIYRNKGTVVQNGSVSLSFDDAKMDLVFVNPAVTTQTSGNLNWSFTNLLPFGSREITAMLNLNTPIEIPAVNNGDTLIFTASVAGTATDETPANNISILNQTVVNALDPNDKTCLEGTTMTPEMIGKDIHYLIRFENSGTANAQNIVVKDMIDTTKFDIESLVPIDGSAPFTTRITGDKVEFIFENINLPFDDANNDGYVAFKIKTRPTLALGDTFSNSASIYFDYNFPIVTNTATTTISALAKTDFVFGNYFKVYPNPVRNVLNIETTNQINVTSISIYNTLGQLVLVIPNAQQIKTVDVSDLTTGNYFLKVDSDKGTSNAKFVKN